MVRREVAPSDEKSPRRVTAAVALTFAAGLVDGYGYLALSKVYIANMSGNTVQLALKAVAGDGRAALVHGFTVAMFMVGLLVGGALIETGLRQRMRRVVAMALALELAALAAFIVLAPGPPDKTQPLGLLLSRIAAAAVAMGLQNTSLRMAGMLTTFTTHVTGTLTRFSEDIIACTIGRGGRPPIEDPGHGRAALLSGCLWIAFVIGVTVAALLMPRVGRIALVIPFGIVCAVVAIDLAAPMAAMPDPKK